MGDGSNRFFKLVMRGERFIWGGKRAMGGGDILIEEGRNRHLLHAESCVFFLPVTLRFLFVCVRGSRTNECTDGHPVYRARSMAVVGPTKTGGCQKAPHHADIIVLYCFCLPSIIFLLECMYVFIDTSTRNPGQSVFAFSTFFFSLAVLETVFVCNNPF